MLLQGALPQDSNMCLQLGPASCSTHRIDLLLHLFCPVIFRKHASARVLHGYCCPTFSNSAHAARFLCLQDGRREVKPGEQPVGNWARSSCSAQPLRRTMPKGRRRPEAFRRLHRLLQHAQTTQAQHPPL